MAKIHKFQGDITKEIANSLKESIAIDTETLNDDATSLDMSPFILCIFIYYSNYHE